VKSYQAERQTTWRDIVRPSVASEVRLQAKVASIIKKRFNVVAKVARDQGYAFAYAFAARPLYDDNHFKPISSMYLSVATYYARRTYNESTAAFQDMLKGVILPQHWKSPRRFDALWRAALEQWLRLHGATFVQDINNTTRKDLMRILNKASDAGLSQMDVYNLLIKSNVPTVRAARIARTETTRAVNAGILLGGASLPYETMKEWVTAEDERVRDNPFSHTTLHGRVIPLDASFNNGEDIRFPGDPLASAENVINCRCMLRVLPNLDERRRPIFRGEDILDTDILFRLSDLL
jgi:hypothetical protein